MRSNTAVYDFVQPPAPAVHEKYSGREVVACVRVWHHPWTLVVMICSSSTHHLN